MGPIFILLGPPAAGKSTLSKAILARFARGVHIPVDDLREFVVAGVAHPVPEWTEETTRQFELAERTAADIAARYSDADFAVAIDHLHNPPSIERNIVAPLAPRVVHRILLSPSLQVNLKRNRERTNKPFPHEFLIKTIEGVHAEGFLGPYEGWIEIDNSDLSIDETVDRILMETGVGR